MKAMILAAGRGKRMGILTEHTAKPLLKVAGFHLIEYVIANLKRAGIVDIVINIHAAHFGEKIADTVGNGSHYGVNICYSREIEHLEVGGGIQHALPLLGEQAFVVISGDIITDFPIQHLFIKEHYLANLVLVPNPSFHLQGDFGLNAERVDFNALPRFTFGNIGLYHPKLFIHHPPGFFPWRSVIFPYIEKQLISGLCYQGLWHNVGTPEDLTTLNSRAAELKLSQLL